jgi:hypothetical protein
VRLSSEASRATSSSTCWGQTRRKSVLGLPPTTSPTSPSRPAETNCWAGGVHGAVHRDVPPRTTRPPGRPGDDLRQQPPRDRRRLWVYNDSDGTDHALARPHVGVQRLCGLFIEQLSTGASSAPPRRRHPTVGSAQRTHRGETPARQGAGPSTPGAGRGCRAPRPAACAVRSCAGAAS